MTLAVVFDLDDTLYPERQYNLSGFTAVGEHVLRRYGIDRFGELCRELFCAGVRGNIFNRACLRLDVALPVEELVSAYRDHLPQISLFDDGARALEHLRGKHPLGLLTDGYAGVQRRKIEALGISPYFDSIVVSDELGGRDTWKPSVAPYCRSMEALAGPDRQFVYVADNPTKDFITARALGWKTVRVERPEGIHPAVVEPGHEADCVVATLDEVPWQHLEETP
jgi:putative hydrolase of the HAD superfamily